MAETVSIEPRERRVRIDGRRIQLRAKSFDVLTLLASRPGHVYPRDVIVERVWEGRTVSYSVLTGCIREIRRALGDTPHTPRWIETVAGTGYRMLKPATVIPAARPVVAGSTLSPEAANGSSATVAVLRFLSSEPALAELARALARDMAFGLARTRWLQVIANASVESLPPGSRPVDAASLLGVRYILEGDLRRGSPGLVLGVSLVEAASERILWADRIAGNGNDPVDMMTAVCAKVVCTVETEIEAAEQRRALLSPIRGLDPWIGFHRAMSLLRKQSPAILDTAGQILAAAAREDPACARLAAARSWLNWQRLFFGLAEDRERALSGARDFALESVALDARDPLGHWALGRIEWLAGDLEASAVNLERAVGLNPSFAVAQYSLGISLYMLGREREAIERVDSAIRLSPLDPMAFAFHCLRAQLACFTGDRVAALDHARRAADHPNVHAYGLALSAWVNELCGSRDAALACLKRMRSRSPSYSRTDYAAAMFHRSVFPEDRRRAIDAAFDRLGF